MLLYSVLKKCTLGFALLSKIKRATEEVTTNQLPLLLRNLRRQFQNNLQVTGNNSIYDEELCLTNID